MILILFPGELLSLPICMQKIKVKGELVQKTDGWTDTADSITFAANAVCNYVQNTAQSTDIASVPWRTKPHSKRSNILVEAFRHSLGLSKHQKIGHNASLCLLGIKIKKTRITCICQVSPLWQFNLISRVTQRKRLFNCR